MTEATKQSNRTSNISSSTNESHESMSKSSHPPQPSTFRPTFPTRSSYNYTQAEAQSRAERSSTSAIDAKFAVIREGEASSQLGGHGEMWKPGFGRTQSWSEQDMKHSMQARLMEGGNGPRGLGFSEDRKV
ncbi:MAG: hypothetical protein M1827_001764 [Pycnora praestabilis]|nr:MAG: hypothetical protein M1827_001764 [Pycnora praestabilis]